MSTPILIHAMTPVNVIAAMSAMTLNEGEDWSEVVLLLHQPGLPAASHRELTAVVERMVAHFPLTLRSLNSEQWAQATATPEALKQTLGLSRVERLYYAHDVVGNTLAKLRAAYPGMRRICFGDALGQIFEKHVHLGYILNPAPPGNSRKSSVLRRLLTRLRYGKVADWRTPQPLPDEAVLILPIDQSGKVLSVIPYKVCPRETVLAVLARMQESCDELMAYLNKVETVNQPSGIFLTENFAESECITLEREIDFYVDIVRKTFPVNSRLFVKGHPGENLPRAQMLAEALGNDYTVVPSDPAFRRYPIELWAPILRNRVVVCTQYPVLSLDYLYGIKVVQPLTYGLIEEFFPPNQWMSCKNALALNMVAKQRLDGWDGKTPLYSGHGDMLTEW